MREKILYFLFGVACFLATQLHAQELVNGTYYIKRVEDLKAFAEKVNAGENRANALLTCDLDLAEDIHQPIGTNECPYMGHFDGGLHSIYNLRVIRPNEAQVGFFGTVGGECIIENLIIGSGRVQGLKAAAGIAGAVRGNAGSIVRFENCGNEAFVSCSDANAAGILGCNYDGNTTIRFVNCYNNGTIRGGKESAAICGWVGGAPGSSLVNCYNSGRISGMEGTKNLYRASDDKVTWTNCFDVALGQAKSQGDKSVKPAEARDGILCFRLGTPFTQNLGEDRYPTFGHKKVTEVTANQFINEDDSVLHLSIVDGETALGLHLNCILDTVHYTRNFIQTEAWEPLYVPFDSKVEDWIGKTLAQFYDLRYVDENGDGNPERGIMEFVILPQGEIVKHNTPYIIKAEAADAFVLNCEYATHFCAEIEPIWCASTDVIYTLVGSNQAVEVEAGTDAWLQDGEVKTSMEAVTLAPQRWRLHAESRTGETLAPLLPMEVKVYMHDVTSIQDLRPILQGHTFWTDLAGRKTQTPRRGVYVKGNQKYFIK